MNYGHLQADCLYTGINSGPNARYRVWESLYLFTFYQNGILGTPLPTETGSAASSGYTPTPAEMERETSRHESEMCFDGEQLSFLVLVALIVTRRRRSVVRQRHVVGVLLLDASRLRHRVHRRGGVGARVGGAATAARAEHSAERGAELTTHRAVDDEVERIAENDDHVHEQRRHLVRPSHTNSYSAQST